jgi:uncharacterized repeat protein (TIGR01451 family)
MTPTVTFTPTSNRVCDFELTMTASPEPVRSGDLLTYTLVLTNLGPRLAPVAFAGGSLPPEVVFVSCSIQGAGFATPVCSSGSASFTNFQDEGKATITMTTMVVATSGTISYTAVAGSSCQLDPNPGNNSATVTSTIGNGPTVTPTPTFTSTATFTAQPTATFTPTPTPTPGGPPFNFYSLAACRVVDTRLPAGPYGGPSFAAGADRAYVLGGQCNIPPTASAVALNVIAVQPDSPGFLTLSAGGTAKPPVSTINYKVGATRANNAIIALGLLQDITVHCAQAAGKVDVVIDVNGYFAP